MLPLPQANGAPAPSQSGRGALELSKVITEPARFGRKPTKAADLCCWVVPVLPAIGRSQPTCRAAVADVPTWSSLLSAVNIVSASPGSTAWLHAASVSGTAAPLTSVIVSIGLG